MLKSYQKIDKKYIQINQVPILLGFGFIWILKNQ